MRIIIPGTGKELLRGELAGAFTGAGCQVIQEAPDVLHHPSHPRRLAELLDGSPTLVFSVNFQGLSPLKPVLELLQQTGGTVAVWCVDNPWNLLAGVRDPRWKTLPLFVTDASFIPPLREHGAERVFHLPLAASPGLFGPNPARDARFPSPGNLAPFVFVGRSQFPGKEQFFAGQTVPQTLLQEAAPMLMQGARPDLLWWERKLACAPGSFWPGKKARGPALGAEEANLLWRSACLQAAAAGAIVSPGGPALDVFGDAGWGDLLPEGARLRPPVDYYTRLPGIYTKARFSLCLTSLQLPHGLNQRHFDVWMAGGLCLSDATPGLSLFPEELTRPITFSHPASIASVAEQADVRRAELTTGWQQHIAEHHTYAHRVAAVLDAVFSRY